MLKAVEPNVWNCHKLAQVHSSDHSEWHLQTCRHDLNTEHLNNNFDQCQKATDQNKQVNQNSQALKQNQVMNSVMNFHPEW